jgi:hypothetical protein
MGRGDKSFFGKTRSVYLRSEFSDWYSTHMEPQHEHLWEPKANIAVFNRFGWAIEGGTGPSRNIPIFLLTPSQHQRFLEHVTNIEAMKTLFAGIIRQRSEDDPMEEGFVLVQAIEDWEKASYPGTWDDWWDRRWKEWKETRLH